MINVSFGGFWRAVNAVGCVYGDIDRRYFNDSAEYTYINVQAGYQRLCGRKALQYVRFRHEDNDLVRSARQQDFLRQTKQQINYTDLIAKRDRLVKIFGRNTTTDTGLRSRSEVLSLLKLAVFSAGKPIQEVHFEGLIGPSYVEASDDRVKKLVQEFLQDKDTPGPARRAQGAAPRRRSASARHAGDAGARGRHGLRQGPGRPGRAAGRGRDAARALPAHAPARLDLRRPAARLQDPGQRQELRRLPHDHQPRRRSGRVLRRAGHDLEGPADPRGRLRDAHFAGRSTSSTTTATACGWWPGGPARRPTGSPTRCSRPSPSAR